jgi:hypothetical protein
MPQTWNTPEASETPGAHKQAGRPGAIVTQYRATERSRRSRRWARDRLDELVGIPDRPIRDVDYDAMGFTLGMPERRAAGLAILERERGWAA